MATTPPPDRPGKYLVGLAGTISSALAGVWLMTAPFALTYQPDDAEWADATMVGFFTGLVVLVVSLVSAALLAAEVVGALPPKRATGAAPTRPRDHTDPDADLNQVLVPLAARLLKDLESDPRHNHTAPSDQPPHHADDVVTAVRALWESWEPDALIADQASGRFADPAKIHPVDHRGAHVTVKGALNVPRSPQGRPVILQAGGSPQGVALAARHADAVFAVNHTLEAAKSFYADVKSRAVHHGRRAEDVLILPGLFPVIGGTEAEALARKEWLDETAGLQDELAGLAATLGVPAEALDLDARLPWPLLQEEPSGPSQGFRTAILALAEKEDLTTRQLLARNPSGHRSVVGAPEQIADSIEEWFRAGAADGFNLNTDFFPGGLELIVDELVPVLQRRGLFRTEYESATLRGNLGLPG